MKSWLNLVMKKSPTLLKQKGNFTELANERINEIQNLSKQTDFNNMIYYFKGLSCSRKFICFTGPIFYKNLKDDYTTL